MSLFDSCIYPNSYTEKDIKILIEKLKKTKINKAILQLDSRKKINHGIILKISKNNKNIIASYGFNSKLTLNQNLNLIEKFRYSVIKIHPRYMEKKIGLNFKYYDQIFNKLPKNLLIQWCSINSWQNNDLPETSQLKFLNKLINKHKERKIIIMHGGGPNLLKYYENFRFYENIYLDLSYTLCHYFNSSLIYDMQFLCNKFDRRIIVGSDYPCFEFSEFSKKLKFLTNKLNKNKKKNIFYQNLNHLTEFI